ncbi:MAG: hypothetical protein KDC12_09595 [Flavobacteriales bacterium]|nr:hypothetical protein [Flavobacteriales bacterium]
MSTTVREFFLLQRNMATRRMNSWGLPGAWGWLALPVLFIVLSTWLYVRTSFAPWIMVAFCAWPLSILNHPARVQFLSQAFAKWTFIRIRLLENVGAALPFVVVLTVHSNWVSSAIAALLVPLFIWTPLRKPTWVIPSPFSRFPWEFSSGYRRSWPLIVMFYLIIITGIQSGNFNWSAFGLVLLLLLPLRYYNEPEPLEYLMIYTCTPVQFLRKKIGVGAMYTLLLVAPACIMLALAFPEFILVQLAFLTVGLMYLATWISAKYSDYPYKLGVKSGMLIAYSFVFPPFLLGIIPFFFLKSVQKLKTYLS